MPICLMVFIYSFHSQLCLVSWNNQVNQTSTVLRTGLRKAGGSAGNLLQSVKLLWTVWYNLIIWLGIVKHWKPFSAAVKSRTVMRCFDYTIGSKGWKTNQLTMLLTRVFKCIFLMIDLSLPVIPLSPAFIRIYRKRGWKYFPLDCWNFIWIFYSVLEMYHSLQSIFSKIYNWHIPWCSWEFHILIEKKMKCLSLHISCSGM